jgi:transposase
MSHPFGQADLVNQQLITVAQVDHLPIVAHFARRIGLVETINRLVPTQMEVQPGLIVLGMVLDTLSGRSPLYHLEAAFETMDRELLFGEPLPASYFNDDNVGGVLDDVFQANTQMVFAELSRLAAAVFALSHHHVHFDTTSISLYGEYRGADPDKETVHITHGYSKDTRPDLKQVVLSLLCIEGNIPIIGSMEDGNASDKTINHQVLNEVAKHMRTHGVEEEAFIYIADSAMVTEPNLAQAGRFITRLPATYNEHERVIMEAVEEEDQGYPIGRIAHTKPTQNRPGAEYRVQDRSVTLYGQSYRAIVVHSSAHDQRRQKRLDRDIHNSLKEAKALAKAAEKRLEHCRPDAEEAAIELRARGTTYHRFEVTVEALPK